MYSIITPRPVYAGAKQSGVLERPHTRATHKDFDDDDFPLPEMQIKRTRSALGQSFTAADLGNSFRNAGVMQMPETVMELEDKAPQTPLTGTLSYKVKRLQIAMLSVNITADVDEQGGIKALLSNFGDSPLPSPIARSKNPAPCSPLPLSLGMNERVGEDYLPSPRFANRLVVPVKFNHEDFASRTLSAGASPPPFSFRL